MKKDITPNDEFTVTAIRLPALVERFLESVWSAYQLVVTGTIMRRVRLAPWFDDFWI